MITKDEKSIGKDNFEKEVLPFISYELKNILNKIDVSRFNSIEEIRLRAYKPLMLQDSQGDWFVGRNGQLYRGWKESYIVTKEDIARTLELMSENSIYAFQEEIKNGFITLKGGHRVGMAGKVVFEGNNIKNIKDISGLNIRVSREVTGCSSKVIRFLLDSNKNVYNTLIISPPQCGKTTILRDIARAISDGIEEYNFKGIKVGIIDERSEIAACYRGVAQNHVGVRTDVLDGCPKASGMDMMLRSMSPNVIITDEIGNCGDRDAVMRVVNAGVKIISSAHGYNISELKARQEVLGLIENRVFERYVVLSNALGPGTLEEVVDGTDMKIIYGRC